LNHERSIQIDKKILWILEGFRREEREASGESLTSKTVAFKKFSNCGYVVAA
jgi:hypothetical protein